MVPNLLRAAMLPWPAQTVFPVGNGISSFDGWSPRPTQSPQVHELLKRELETDGSQTCGYYNGIRGWCSPDFFSCVNIGQEHSEIKLWLSYAIRELCRSLNPLSLRWFAFNVFGRSQLTALFPYQPQNLL